MQLINILIIILLAKMVNLKEMHSIKTKVELIFNKA